MKHWKAIIGVILVFALGMIAGGLVTARVMRHRVRAALARGPEGAMDLVVRRMGAELRLDSGQRELLRVIVTDAQQQMKAVRGQAEPQIKEILGRAETKVREMLRPEQRAKFDKLIASSKAKW